VEGGGVVGWEWRGLGSRRGGLGIGMEGMMRAEQENEAFICFSCGEPVRDELALLRRSQTTDKGPSKLCTIVILVSTS